MELVTKDNFIPGKEIIITSKSKGMIDDYVFNHFISGNTISLSDPNNCTIQVIYRDMSGDIAEVTQTVRLNSDIQYVVLHNINSIISDLNVLEGSFYE